MLAAKLESGAKRVKRSFGRNIPFEAETRSKRQAVSATLPKVSPTPGSPSSSSSPPPSPQPASPRADEGASAAADAAAAAEAPAVYVHESRLAHRLSDARGAAPDRALGKRVQFGAGTKAWNGLRRDRHYLDQLLHEFFVLGKQFASVDVLRLIGLDSALVGGVLALLNDLCARVKSGSENDEDGVPVLLEGGGRGMKVSLFHHPYLQSLQRVVAEAEHIAALKITIGDQKQPQQGSPQQGSPQQGSPHKSQSPQRAEEVPLSREQIPLVAT